MPKPIASTLPLRCCDNILFAHLLLYLVGMYLVKKIVACLCTNTTESREKAFARGEIYIKINCHSD